MTTAAASHPRRAALAAALLLAAALPAGAETSPDGVEVVPLYVDDQGNGILRYEDPAGGSDEYEAAVGGLSDDKVRPFEVFGGLGSGWKGPRVSLCIEGLRKDGLMDGHLAYELYNRTQAKPVMRYRPVFDAEKAEAIVTVGEGAGPGECSRNYVP
ncbi:hypothetical protein [Ostreiculturibacter nitratireducens]|uniref:hypothetical protein n=1 Tax=Ostreiculturibacter nitratireducens TaxID=3075226 RepID=UPI0031B5DCB5